MGFKSKLWAFVAGIGSLAVAILAFFLGTKRTQPTEVDLERVKKEAEEEIEKTPAKDLVANSVNADKHSTAISQLQSGFKSRTEERLQNLLNGAGDSAGKGD